MNCILFYIAYFHIFGNTLKLHFGTCSSYLHINNLICFVSFGFVEGIIVAFNLQQTALSKVSIFVISFRIHCDVLCIAGVSHVAYRGIG